MKADQYGGWTEQVRFKQGWRQSEKQSQSRCDNCKHFGPISDLNKNPYCKAPEVYFATRKTATCNLFEIKS